MEKVGYSVFKEAFDRKQREEQMKHEAFLLDVEEMGKGDSLWEDAHELGKQWHEMKQAIMLEDGADILAIRSTYRLIEDFVNVPEEMLLNALKCLGIEVVR
jgi:hypothetical protein